MFKSFAPGRVPGGRLVASAIRRHALIALLGAMIIPLRSAIAQEVREGPVQWAPSHGISHEWRLQGDYLGAREANRPIDIVSVTAARVWRFPFGVQGSLGFGILNATGNRIEPGRQPINSDATGVLLGGGLRVAPVRIGPVEPFAEGTVHFLWTAGHPFPAEGSSVNGFVRWGGGANVRLSDRISVEVGYHAAHVSNGGGLVPYNPAWNGRGGFVGLNWRSGK